MFLFIYFFLSNFIFYKHFFFAGKFQVLLNENEKAFQILSWPPETTLFKWVGYCLKLQGYENKKVTKFSDLSDCYGLAAVLATLYPDSLELNRFETMDPSERPQLIVDIILSSGFPTRIINARAITTVHEETLWLTLAYIYSTASARN